MEDGAALDAAGARELQEERERCQKMKQENQVLLKKLHDVVGRYRQLQQQYQTMVNERQEHQQELHDAAGATMSGTTTDAKSSAMGGGESPTNHGNATDDPALKKLEAEKHELIEKLKQVVGTCRIMQKQLQEAKEENEALKSPAKPMLTGSHHDATEALEVRVIALEREVAQKEGEKEEIVGKLKEVISRYQSLQKQLEDKICEHDAAMTKVAALEMELRTQQSSSSSSSSSSVSWIRRSSGGSNSTNNGSTDQQLQAKEKEITKLKEDVQKLTIAITQEEARTAVFREENARLKEQVASIIQETQQQEQHLRDENSSFAQQIAELQRQAELMKKQQEDSEHLYMEVASKLNHTLRENGDLQDRMVSLQQSIQEAEQAREHAASEHAAHIARLEQQLSAAEAAHVNSSVHEDEIAEMKLQIDKLTLRESRLISLESDLADHGVGTAYSSIAELIQAKEHSYQENISLHSRQIEELRSQLEVKSDLESTLISLREQSTEQSLIIAKLQEELTCMTEERDAALIAKDSEVESLRCTHDQEICRLREQIERLESQLGTDNESASLVEQQLNDLRVQLEASAKETIAKDQAISEKQGQLVELESKFQNAQNALDETKRMLDESVEENEALRKTIAEGEAAHAELKCAFAEVEARYAHDGGTRIEELESQLSVKVSVVEELTCELQSVRAQLEESVALCKTAAAAEQKKLEAATARSKELEEFVAKLKEQLTGVYATVEHDQQVVVSQLNERIVHFESEVSEREARLTKAMEDIVQLNHQVSTLRDELASTQASALEEKEALVTAHMAVISSLQQQLADSFNEHEEELKEKSEKLEEAERDISALRNQVATWKAQQRQIDADSNEVVNDLQEQVARLQSECESARKEVEKVQEDKSGLEERVADTEGHLDRVVAEKDRELDAVRSGLEKEVERLCGEVNTLQEELASARRESDQYAQQVEVIQGQLAALPLTRREIVGEETNDSTTVSMDALLEDLRMNLAKAEEYERQMSEISSATSTLRDQLACATTEMGLAESRCASFENEIQSLNDQLQSVRVEKDHLHAEIKALQSELLRRSEIIESLKAEDASKEDQKTIQLNERIAELTATVSDTENELAAIKAENTRMVFEVAKTTDSAVKLKQDYDQVQVQHKSKCDEVDSLQLLVQEVESRSALLTQDIQEKARLIDELQGELSSLQESTTTSFQEMQTRLEASSAEIERLKDELSNTSDLNERLQSELDATKTAVEEVKRLEEELTQSKECIESMLEQKRNLIEQISIGNSERTTLTDELSSLQSSSTERINYLEARIESMASELRAINDQLERTQGEKRSIEEHVQALEAELKAKASDVQSLTEQITLVQEEKTGCEAHAEALEATVTAKTVELRSLNEEIAGLREENISLSQQIERITTAASSHSSEVSQLTEDLIALRKEKSEMEATIDEKTIEMDALREELKLMVENKRTLEEKVQHLEEQVELQKLSSSEQTTQLEASHETLLSKVQDLTSEIESLREAAEMNAQEHQHLQDTIREKEGAMEALQDECVILTSKLKIVSSDLSTRDAHFEGLIAQKDGVIRELQDQLAAVSDRSSGLQSETRDLKEQILVKKKDAVAVSKSLEQLVTLRTEVKESHIAIKECDDIAQEVRVELDSLRTQCTQFESRIRELLQQLAENEEQIKLNRRLEEQLAELRELSKHHEASLSVKEESLRKLEDEVTLLSEQKMQLETQVEELKMQFELKGDDEDVVAALKEKVGALEAELRETTSSAEQIQTTQRQELEVFKASISQKDEIIGKLKTKTEEVLGMYKKLKEHAQDLQEQLAEKTTEAVSQHEEMESMLATHARLSEELAATKQASRALEDAMESMKRDQEQLSTATTGELSAAKADLEAMQLKYEEVTERLASEKDELTKEIAALQESKNDLIRTVQEKIDDHQRVEEQLKELQTRHDEMKLLHEQVISESSRLRSELEECCAEVVKLKEEHSGIGAVHEEMTTKLQEEVASLRAQLDVEIEGANAARTALEVYKKRAATALKKATYESKSSIKKVEEETTQLQQDFAEATAKVAALERELEEAQKQLEEAEAVSAAQVRAVKEKAEEEKSRDELEWKKALESVEGQLVSLRAELDAKSHLDVRISELEELNLSLSETVDSLKKEVQHKSEVSREMLKVKDNEIAELTKEVEEAKRAANEAAQQLKSAPLPSVSVFETPEQGRSSPRRSSAEHEHLAAAMADVQSSISMTVTTSTVSTNGVDGQIIQLARTQAMRDEESTKIKLQLQALEEQVRCFQTKYEDTLALLEESTRQKRRLQELSTRTTDGLNIEYLKNVVIKYIESQNPSEKDRLIPVIATVLHFSPQEMKKINDAHQKAHEEAGGLLGGVFSLFGAAPAAPPPKPLAIPANLNLRQPSPGSMASPGMEQDDDDDQMTPLNPFAANSY